MSGQPKVIDLLVVGGGTAGIVGAKTAAGLGAETLLVERERTGGDCLWTGCVPSKTLLAAAADAARERASGGAQPDFAAVRERIAAAIAAIEPADSPAALEAEGARVLHGALTFTAPGAAEVQGRQIRFRQALIATGAAPTENAVPGLDPALAVTSDTVWQLETLPPRLVIVGGGPIACELGQAFARLGSQVTLIARSRILAKEDSEAAALVRASLEADGIRVLEGQGSARAGTVAGAARITTANGSTADGDVVLIATGRTPRTAGLGLELLGVNLDSKGHVLTDDRMRTSNPRMWAAGDVTAHQQFTHLAGVHASVAASNAVLGVRRRVTSTVPRVTFTSPEVAAVGRTTADGGTSGKTASVRVRTVHHTHADRAITEGRTDGFTRLVVDRSGKILGGTIVGPRAGESLAELALAVQKGMTTSDIAGTTHAYPTYSDGVWNAALADVRERLGSGPMRAAVRVLVRTRRTLLDMRSRAAV